MKMLFSQYQHNQLYLINILRLPPITGKPTRHILPPCSSTHHRQNPQTASSSDDKFLRAHNAKSSSLILRYLSDNQETGSEFLEKEDKIMPLEEKVKILEMSLIRKRTPQFPGSIYVQSPSDPQVNASLPPIQTLFEGVGRNDFVADTDDYEMLMKALEIRRKVTVEIFKEAMKKGKFGITYTSNLLPYMSDYIDFVMIQAASMKQWGQFSSASFNVRARTFINDSGVVALIRWLKHNSLSYPQIGKLICMSKGNLYAIRQLAEWLKSNYVKGRFIGIAMMRAGDKILENSIEQLDEIVIYLERNGVRRDWMGYVLSRCPEVLSFSMEELRSRVEFYLNMGMNEEDFGTMVFDFPKVLGFFSMEEMNQKVAYLKEFGLNDEEVGRLIAFKPQLMACSIEERWKPLVKYFYYLGISKENMKRILIKKAMIFCVDLESIIVPKVQFFQDIGVQDDAIGNMIAKFPPLLTYSLQKKIRPVVIFLLTKAGVTQKDIGKVIALGPELLGCSVANKLEHNVKYFLSLGISLRQLGQMISDFPMLLRYNIDILRPKYRYLRRTMVRPLRDLIEFPRFFSYSLEDRIVPRHRIMVENRINFKLRYMLSDSDEEFEERVKAAVLRRQRFESGMTNVEDEPPLASQGDVGSMTNMLV
ncbi:OLC1v1003203C3 [Oldenlandia corymbosa var. corymbosa]|uniref:OLC1v1003203C3 n=1 Tax=Oldenlandia corymbosa var. corymbosa TaxID=529605 RepID=A0AAV1DBV4_OLDCO|nr:OLC1v1003203C3 [Oldenlandia corymbosa var. corymbosa]